MHCFTMKRTPLLHIWIIATKQCLDYPRCKTKIVDAQLTLMFLMGQHQGHALVCLRNTAITPYMNHCLEATQRLHKMQRQKLLTLHWRLFSGWGREHVAFVLPVKDAKISSMDVCNQSPRRLPMMQIQKLLSLRWHLFSELASNSVTISFVYEGGQNVGYG